MSKWILTDDSTGQYVLKPYPELDIYNVIDTVARVDDRYAVIVGAVVFDPACDHRHDVHSPGFAAYFLHPYGYESFEALQQEYGESALQIAAECVFETHMSTCYPAVFNGTLDECLDYIDDYVRKNEKN